MAFDVVTLASCFPTFRRNLMPLLSGDEGSKGNGGVTFVWKRGGRLTQRHRVQIQGDSNILFPLPACFEERKVHNILTIYSLLFGMETSHTGIGNIWQDTAS